MAGCVGFPCAYFDGVMGSFGVCWVWWRSRISVCCYSFLRWTVDLLVFLGTMFLVFGGLRVSSLILDDERMVFSCELEEA